METKHLSRHELLCLSVQLKYASGLHNAVWYLQLFKDLISLTYRLIVAGMIRCHPALLLYSWVAHILTMICQQVVAATITRQLSRWKQANSTWLTVLPEQTEFRQSVPQQWSKIPTTTASSSGRSLHPPPRTEKQWLSCFLWSLAYSMGIMCGCVMVTNPICSLILDP